MSHGVKYLAWRGGKPRWVPGPNLRDRGFKGQDLKDEDGNWLPAHLAAETAHKLNLEAGVASELPQRSPAEWAAEAPARHRRHGYVYFLVAGEHVKIGFSKRPAVRVRELVTGLPAEIEILVALPASQVEEKLVHRKLKAYVARGEWFHACQPVLNLILRSLRARRIVLDSRPVDLGPLISGEKAQ